MFSHVERVPHISPVNSEWSCTGGLLTNPSREKLGQMTNRYMLGYSCTMHTATKGGLTEAREINERLHTLLRGNLIAGLDS